MIRIRHTEVFVKEVIENALISFHCSDQVHLPSCAAGTSFDFTIDGIMVISVSMNFGKLVFGDINDIEKQQIKNVTETVSILIGVFFEGNRA